MPDGTSPADEARRKAERRAFIRATHPDAGGDPQHFIAGLADFDARGPHAGTSAPTWRAEAAASPRPQVHRSRRPDRVVLRSVRELRRRVSGKPARRLQ